MQPPPSPAPETRRRGQGLGRKGFPPGLRSEEGGLPHVSPRSRAVGETGGGSDITCLLGRASWWQKREKRPVPFSLTGAWLGPRALVASGGP